MSLTDDDTVGIGDQAFGMEQAALDGYPSPDALDEPLIDDLDLV